MALKYLTVNFLLFFGGDSLSQLSGKHQAELDRKNASVTARMHQSAGATKTSFVPARLRSAFGVAAASDSPPDLAICTE